MADIAYYEDLIAEDEQEARDRYVSWFRSVKAAVVVFVLGFTASAALVYAFV